MIMLSTHPTLIPKAKGAMVIEKESTANYTKSEVEDLEGSTVGRTDFTETEQKEIL